MARIYKVSTTLANLGISAAPAIFVIGDTGALTTGFLGLTATNGTGQAYYIKLFWTGNNNLTFAQMKSMVTNAAATVVPSITVQVPTTGLPIPQMGNYAVVNQGQLYLWAVSTATDGTNTSLSAGGDAITVFID